MSERFPDFLRLALLAFAWLSAMVLVNPSGDFPLNDDWIYAKTVQHLLETGVLEPIDWAGAIHLSQTLWGAFFCLLFGFSFDTLRISTLVLSLITIISAYGLFRLVTENKDTAMLGALVVLCNPLFLKMSNTFMTDVPFLAFFLTSLMFLINGIKSDSAKTIIIGLIIGVLATFNREIGASIFIGFAVGYLVKKGFNIRNAVLATLPLVIVFTLFWLYSEWISNKGMVSVLQRPVQEQLLGTMFAGLKEVAFKTGSRTIGILFYLGIFLMPFLFWQSAHEKRQAPRAARWVIFSSVLTFTAGLIFMGHTMPYLGNLLFKVGCGSPELSIGPNTLRDTFFLCSTSSIQLGIPARVILTLAGAIGMAWFLVRESFLAEKLWGWRNFWIMKSRYWLQLFLAAVAGTYFLPAILVPTFDRYVLPLLPLAIAFGAIQLNENRQLTRGSHIASACLLVLYLTFSLTATHDYMEWNRARWKAVSYLTKTLKISWQKIDGGYEFNGWHGYRPEYKRKGGKSWWWVEDDEFIISFNPIKGYEVIQKVAYNSWMERKQKSVFVLQRTSLINLNL